MHLAREVAENARLTRGATMTFTEAQIREAMKHHRPGNEGDCLCAWGIEADPSQEFTVDHLIDVLKEGQTKVAVT